MPSALPPRHRIRDPLERIERQALEVMLQLPGLARAANAQELPARTFTVPTHQAVHDAIRAAGGVFIYDERLAQLRKQGDAAPEERAAAWYVDQVMEHADGVVAQAVTQLSVEPLPEAGDQWPYVRGIMMSLIRQGITRQIAEVRGQMRRTAPDSPDQDVLFARLIELENQRRAFDETDT